MLCYEKLTETPDLEEMYELETQVRIFPDKYVV